MANGIEFTSRVGKAFTAWVIKSPSYVTIESGSTVTEVSPGRYRVDTIVDSGKVWFEATAGAIKAYGWADLDNPGLNDFSDVLESLAVLGEIRKVPRGASQVSGGATATKTNTSITPNQSINERIT